MYIYTAYCTEIKMKSSMENLFAINPAIMKNMDSLYTHEYLQLFIGSVYPKFGLS